MVLRRGGSEKWGGGGGGEGRTCVRVCMRNGLDWMGLEWRGLPAVAGVPHCVFFNCLCGLLFTVAGGDCESVRVL